MTAISRRAHRPALADEFLAVLPDFRRRMQAHFPQDLREELTTVTAHQFEALARLTESGGTTMNSLARSLDISLSSCTSLADRLIRQGLVERTSDPADRRVVRLVPTELARGFCERYRAAKLSSAVAAMSNLDDDEVRTLIALLRKLSLTDVPEAAAS
jgi:DNA-binding MarR family transcriptional regulator